MSDFETIIYEKRDGTGYVTLNRPQALNAYNIQMRDELYQALGAIRDDPEVRVMMSPVSAKQIRSSGIPVSCASSAWL